MQFNKHSNLLGQHSFLSASKYHWINYDQEKLIKSYKNYLAAERGTKLHGIACDLITEGIRLPKSKKTMNMYVNDALGFKMTPEQVLYYSDNGFVTTDAISFRNNTLRIHDYKSGATPASIHQLEVYAAYFCLEYGVNPMDISIELRLYQNDEILLSTPEPSEIERIMKKIVEFDQLIEKLKMEE